MRVIAVPRLRGPGRHRLGAQAFANEIPWLPGSRRCLVLALVLSPLLGGCANNPIARQLAASFDTPAPTPAPSPGAGSPQAAGGAAPQANSAVSYPDPAISQEIIDQVNAQAMAAGQPAPQVPMLHDVQIKRIVKDGHVALRLAQLVP